MTRYLDPDVRDMAEVFRRQKTPPEELAGLWARALRRSPPSSALYLFQRHVEHFFKNWGPRVWGTSFDAEKSVSFFRDRLRGRSVPAAGGGRHVV
jgi:hypothetical protein